MRIALTFALVAGPLLAQAASPAHIAQAHRRDSAPVSNRPQKRSISGFATWFDDGLGACGWWNNPGDFIVAMNQFQFPQDTWPSSVCGKQVRVTGPAGTQTATVADLCPQGDGNCNYGDMDMSTGFFQAVVGDLGIGKAPITWDWVDGSGGGTGSSGGGSGGSSDTPAPATRTRCHAPTGL